MSYYTDQHAMSLEDLRKRLQETDLIPSHLPLLDGIRDKIVCLKKAGIASVGDLRSRLKTAKLLAALSDASGVHSDYLVLLRRAIEGFFPKPQPLNAFDWLSGNSLTKLEKAGVKNTEQLFQAAEIGLSALAKRVGLDAKELSGWIALSDLSRIQWVGPSFARVLVAADYDSVKKIAKAKPEVLCEAVVKANEYARFYKGKIGLRDIKRLIVAASYVP